MKSLREQGPEVGARERWEPDRILGLVKENSTLPAVQGVARSARKVKAWPETVGPRILSGTGGRGGTLGSQS